MAFYINFINAQSTLDEDCHGEESELLDINSPTPFTGKIIKSSVRISNVS